jgi:hypothetical protein
LLAFCRTYFDEVGIGTDVLDQLSVYLDQALNPASHHNPSANFYRRELEQTFIHINTLLEIKNDAIVTCEKQVNLTIECISKIKYQYFFELTDDIRLTKEPNEISKWEENQKYKFKILKTIKYDIDGTETPSDLNHTTAFFTLIEFFEDVCNSIDKKYNELSIKDYDDINNFYKNEEGRTLNQLKPY